MLKGGERAPEFTLPDDTGTDRSLTDFLSTGAAILFFFPGMLSLGGARHARALRDLEAQLQAAKLRVVGVSSQSPQAHARYRAGHRLPFPLLSDKDKEVVKMYGVGGPFGLGVLHTTFLIDGSRRIQDVVQANVLVGRHAQLVRKAIALRAARS